MSWDTVLNTRQTILVSQTTKRIPRGEMWLGSGLFRELEWRDDLEARQRLCDEVGMDILFLPVGSSFSHDHLFGYRVFSLDEISQWVAEDHGLLVSVVVDGPFQRLAQKIGVQSLLRKWGAVEVVGAMTEESIQVGQVVTACLKCKPDALVIADDIAYRHSTYVSPRDLGQSLFASYRGWVQQAHDRGILAFFHSDGNLTSILADLLVCGFDGLAGCELECQDVPAFKRQYGSRLTFLTGVPSFLLDQEELGLRHQQQFTGQLTTLASGGRFVLCSSRGLSSAKDLSRLRTLYHWADEAWNPGSTSQSLLYYPKT
ncbi:MAG: hypothetical protein ACE5JU_03450 [Candidatus Binatia bacterium]